MSDDGSDFRRKLSATAQQRWPRRIVDMPPQHPVWYVVIVPDAGEPYVQQIGTTDETAALAELRRIVRGAVGQEVYCFAFHGQAAAITQGPFRELILPDGRRLPLYDEPTVTLVTPCGSYMGNEQPIQSTPPPTAEEESAEYEVVDEEEEET
jgi:hypothetical protein